MVFDLDPDEGLAFAEVKRAATDIAKVLQDIGLKSWPLLSGGKGVHVVIPLDGSHDYAQTEPFAKAFAQALAAHEPNRFVATMSKQRRKGRIFVDWLRNKKSATAILPWSLRARPGATGRDAFDLGRTRRDQDRRRVQHQDGDRSGGTRGAISSKSNKVCRATPSPGWKLEALNSPSAARRHRRRSSSSWRSTCARRAA